MFLEIIVFYQIILRLYKTCKNLEAKLTTSPIKSWIKYHFIFGKKAR